MENGKWIRGVIVAIVCMLCSSACASGFSNENQKRTLDSLSSYVPLKSSAQIQSKQLKTNQQSDEGRCEDEYSRDKFCLERKYMSGNYFVIKIAFKIEHEPSADLPAQLPKQSYEFENSEDLEAYFNEWTDPIFKEYIGEDYQKFNNTKLVSLNKRYITLSFEVLSALELGELVQDNRIVDVTHIGSPRRPLEEISK